MHVDAPVLRDREDGLRQDLPVRRDHDRVRRFLADALDILFHSQFQRLKNRDPRLICCGGDRAAAHCLAAASLPVRLCDGERHFVAAVDQCFENGDGEIRRPHEYDPQSLLLFLVRRAGIFEFSLDEPDVKVSIQVIQFVADRARQKIRSLDLGRLHVFVERDRFRV